MTTFRSFVDALEALNISGVETVFDKGPPKSLTTERLPAQFVQLPRGEDRGFVFGEFEAIFSQFTADLVVAVEAVGQGEEPYHNFDETVDMMDNVNSALSSVSGCDVIAKTKHTWEIRQTIVQVAGNDYWAVVATVRGSG